MASGDGKQAVYLAEVPSDMGSVLMGLIGLGGVSPELDEIKRRVAEDAEQSRIAAADMPATTKVALVESRVGQGQFRSSVLAVEAQCRFTGVSNPALLTASHIKPWVDSDNVERLDKFNGLMLTPTFDRLFDRGFITLTDTGDVLSGSDLDSRDMHAIGLHLPLNVGPLHPAQCQYLEYHRTRVFRA
ncbi:MAG: HNH endonuclease [Candidatus Nanopelagicales bacterium]|nr:HNH endonuclease [Candidatus Nanopelagicales bacterium]